MWGSLRSVEVRDAADPPAETLAELKRPQLPLDAVNVKKVHEKSTDVL